MSEPLPPGMTALTPQTLHSPAHLPEVALRLADLTVTGHRNRTEATAALLAAVLGCRAAEIDLSADATGRPVLRHPDAPEISVSASDALVLVGLSRERIGVDVQICASDSAVADVTALLHERERHVIDAALPGDRAAVFTRVWTRKEALLKAYGTGLRRDLAADDVTTASGAGWVIADVPVPAAAVPSASAPVSAAVCVLSRSRPHLSPARRA